MNLSAVQASALLLGICVLGVLGTISGLGASTIVRNQNRLAEVATSVADATANVAKTGGSVVSESYTVTDSELGTVQVTITPGSGIIAVSTSVGGITQNAQAETN